MTIKELLTTTEPTEQQLKNAAKATVAHDIASGAMAMLQSLDARHRMEFDRVWNHSTLTPQEVVAELGSLGVTLFTGNTAVSEFLSAQFAAAGEEYIPPEVPQWATIIPNQDGSISIDGVMP